MKSVVLSIKVLIVTAVMANNLCGAQKGKQPSAEDLQKCAPATSALRPKVGEKVSSMWEMSQRFLLQKSKTDLALEVLGKKENESQGVWKLSEGEERYAEQYAGWVKDGINEQIAAIETLRKKFGVDKPEITSLELHKYLVEAGPHARKIDELLRCIESYDKSQISLAQPTRENAAQAVQCCADEFLLLAKRQLKLAGAIRGHARKVRETTFSPASSEPLSPISDYSVDEDGTPIATRKKILSCIDLMRCTQPAELGR